jgi:DNA polymerase I-like protein with 3'-5' exonuclease and polymerase domains
VDPLIQTLDGVSAVRARVVEALKAKQLVGYDSETFGPEFRDGNRTKPDATRHRIAGYSVAFEDGTRFYLPLRHNEESLVGAALASAWKLLRFVLRPEARVVAWNFKYDLMILQNEGLDPRCELLDAELLAWLVGWKLPAKAGLKLKAQAEHRLGYTGPTWEEVSAGRAANEVPAAELAPYAANDAHLALRLWQLAWPRALELNLEQQWRLDQRCIPVTASMERTGVPLDRAKLLDAAAACERELEEVAARFELLTRTTVELPVKVRRPKSCPHCSLRRWQAVNCPGSHGKLCVGGVLHHKNGRPVLGTVEELQPTVAGCDIGSDAKVSRWLFKELGWWLQGDERQHPTVQYGPSVKADYVRRYAADPGPGGEAARLRLRFQALRKYATTYTRSLVALADQSGDGRLHAGFKQDGTDTQRYSSSGPNLQNLPKSTRQPLPWLDALPDIRAAFVTDPGWSVAVYDYGQIEWRLVAHYSRDPAMIADLLSGADPHARMQARLAGTCDRTGSKTGNFSVIYRIQPKALAHKMALATNDFTWTPKRAERVINGFFEEYPLVGDYHDRAVAAAERNGYASSLTGFKRPITDWSRQGRWGSENRAINTPIQSSAAGIIKLAMAELFELWSAAGMVGRDVRFVAQVHDELIVEHRNEVGDRVRADMQRVMVEVGVRLKLRVPLTVSGGSGPNWSEAKA